MNFVTDWLLPNAMRQASCFAIDVHEDAKKIDVEESIARCTTRDGNTGVGRLLGRRQWTCVVKSTAQKKDLYRSARSVASEPAPNAATYLIVT